VVTVSGKIYNTVTISITVSASLKCTPNSKTSYVACVGYNNSVKVSHYK